MKISIIPIPKKIWKRRNLQSAVEDALGAGRRIAKKVNLKHQRRIFSLACSHIERIAVENGEDNIELKGKDACKIITALKGGEGIIYPFVLPEGMSKFREYFKGKILKYLDEIEGGIIVISLPYQASLRDLQVSPILSVGKKPNIKFQDALPVFSLPEDIESSRYKEYFKRAYHQLNEAILSERPFNISAFSHRVFTGLIRDYIHKPPISFWRRLINWLLFWRRIKPIPLQIIYNDGSAARPFPLFSLSRISQPKGFPIIKVGLMSMRHPEELDPLIDTYLLRNREVDRRESCAEQDDISYNRTIQFLSELLKDKNGIEIHLYHTGLEPVVVGTYRAIVETLQNYQGRLVVIPKFPIIKEEKVTGYESSKPWF